jgi:hypothetical protein
MHSGGALSSTLSGRGREVQRHATTAQSLPARALTTSSLLFAFIVPVRFGKRDLGLRGKATLPQLQHTNTSHVAKDMLPLQALHVRLLIFAFFGMVGGCAHLPTGTIHQWAQEQKFIPYIPPQGDPRNEPSWRVLGPGTIFRTRQYEVQYEAQNVLGKPRVSEIMADANDPARRVRFAAISGKRTEGSEFDGQGGWTVPSAGSIKGALHLNNATSVDIQFGDTWVAQISEAELRQSPELSHVSRGTTQSLRSRRFGKPNSHLVLKTIYTDSLKIYFKVAREGGGEIGYKIPLVDEQKLGANFKVTSDGGVQVSGPVMVGYVPLSQAGVEEIFPAR